MNTAVVRESHNSSKKPNGMDILIGGRLRLWRRTIGVNGHVLAKKIGVTYQQLQKYEKGLNRISATRLYEIAKELNVPIDYFYHDADIARLKSGQLTPESKGRNAEQYTLLTDSTGADFLKWYISIEDPVVKKAVVSLVRSLAQMAPMNAITTSSLT